MYWWTEETMISEILINQGLIRLSHHSLILILNTYIFWDETFHSINISNQVFTNQLLKWAGDQVINNINDKIMNRLSDQDPIHIYPRMHCFQFIKAYEWSYIHKINYLSELMIKSSFFSDYMHHARFIQIFKIY